MRINIKTISKRGTKTDEQQNPFEELTGENVGQHLKPISDEEHLMEETRL